MFYKKSFVLIHWKSQKEKKLQDRRIAVEDFSSDLKKPFKFCHQHTFFLSKAAFDDVTSFFLLPILCLCKPTNALGTIAGESFYSAHHSFLNELTLNKLQKPVLSSSPGLTCNKGITPLLYHTWIGKLNGAPTVCRWMARKHLEHSIVDKCCHLT